MDQRDIQFQEFGSTQIEPSVIVATLLAGIALLAVRRSRSVVPVLLIACLIPVSQRVVILTLDFNMVRLLLLIGWLRVLMRDEARGFRLSRLDRIFVAWTIVASVIHVLREQSLGAVTYRLGASFDAIGCYFLFRVLIRDPHALVNSLRGMASICAIVAVTMALEHSTGRNFFAVFGGVPEHSIVREGSIRAQGAFSHPIMAGTFGATLAPLFLALLLGGFARRWLAGIGLVGATLIVVFSSSSGPFIAYAVGGLCWMAWPWRNRVRWMYGSFFGLLLVLHLIREKPVWHLIGRLSSLTGGTGYHRYMLIDAFVYFFPEWALLGTKSTAHWAWGLQDVTNQFVLEGVRGGLLTLIFFVWLLVESFRIVGVQLHGLAPVRPRVPPARLRLGLLVFGIGVSLVTHCVSFISVSYFGQTEFLFYLTLALAGSLMPAPAPRRAQSASARGDPAQPPRMKSRSVSTS